MKERFTRQPEALADYELLELLLGYALPRKDTKPMAKALLERFGSLKGVLWARAGQLEEMPGIGSGTILFWRVWQEFWSRLEKDSLPVKEAVQGPEDVLCLLKNRLGLLTKESTWLILLDNKNRFLELCKVSQGTLDQAPVYPRELFALALKYGASALIMVHNHPGGDPRPSKQDIQLTKQLQSGAAALQLRLLDHLIIAEESWFSLREQGLLG